MRTKKQLYDAFGGRISKTAIRKDADTWEVHGKWSIVSLIDGLWDVFICNPDDLAAGLTQRKVRSVLRRIDERVPLNDTFTELDGEAYFRLDSAEKICEIADLLGIRRSRVMSDAAKERASARLKAWHEEKRNAA